MTLDSVSAVKETPTSLGEPPRSEDLRPLPNTHSGAKSSQPDAPVSRGEKRAANEAGSYAQDSFQFFAQDALEGDETARDLLSISVTGKSYFELTQGDAEAGDAFTDFLKDVASGKIRPNIKVAKRIPQDDIGGRDTGDWLPEGVNGAYVPGAMGTDEPGTILIAEGLDPTQLDATMLEEFGEAFAETAKRRGVDVSAGDVGARLALAVTGGDLDKVPTLFADAPDDTAEIIVDGEVVTAETAQNVVPNSNFPLVTTSFQTDKDVYVYANIQSGDGVWREVLLFTRSDPSVTNATVQVPVNAGETVGEIFIRVEGGIERRSASPGPEGAVPGAFTQNPDGSWEQRYETGTALGDDYADVLISYNPADPQRTGSQVRYEHFGDGSLANARPGVYSVTDLGPKVGAEGQYKLQIREANATELPPGAMPSDDPVFSAATRGSWQNFGEMKQIDGQNGDSGIFVDSWRAEHDELDVELRIVDTTTGEVVSGAGMPGSFAKHRLADGSTEFFFALPGSQGNDGYQVRMRPTAEASPWSDLHRPVLAAEAGAPAGPATSPVATPEPTPAAALDALEMSYLWKPTTSIEFEGADIQVMTEADLIPVIAPHVEAAIIERSPGFAKPTEAVVLAESKKIVDRLGQVQGRMVDNNGADGAYVFAKDDMQSIVDLGTLDDVVTKNVAIDDVVAHKKPGFWKTAWGDLTDPAALIQKLANGVGATEADVAKWLNGEMTAFEARAKGMETLVEGLAKELMAADGALTGLGLELYGSITGNPELVGAGKEWLAEAKSQAAEGGQELLLGTIMTAAGVDQKTAAAALNKAGMMWKMSTHFLNEPADEQLTDLQTQMLPFMQATQQEWESVSQGGGVLPAAKMVGGTGPQGRQLLAADGLNFQKQLAFESAAAPDSKGNGAFEAIKAMAMDAVLPANADVTQRLDMRVNIAALGFSPQKLLGVSNDFGLKAFATWPRVNEVGGLDFQLRVRIDDDVLGTASAAGLSASAGALDVHDLIFDWQTGADGKLLSHNISWSSTQALGVDVNYSPGGTLKNSGQISQLKDEVKELFGFEPEAEFFDAMEGDADGDLFFDAEEPPGDADGDIFFDAEEPPIGSDWSKTFKFLMGSSADAGLGYGMSSTYNFREMATDGNKDRIFGVLGLELIGSLAGGGAAAYFASPLAEKPELYAGAVHTGAIAGTSVVDGLISNFMPGVEEYASYSGSGFFWGAGQTPPKWSAGDLSVGSGTLQYNLGFKPQEIHTGEKSDNQNYVRS